ncbi:MAG: hypothetical protein KME50_08795 [Nostoc desertorum CM1-VF14]|jgi:hypothetical protein|nr:hypothetical protein [Nostoc desertorum CM1-VF14]
MLIFVLQTLAEILAGGTSLTSTEQIEFSYPGNRREEGADPTPVPLVWERIFHLRNQLSRDGDSLVLTRRVAIAGIVKSALTNLPPVAAEVAVR